MPILLSYAPGLRQNHMVQIMTYGSPASFQYWSTFIFTIILITVPLYFILADINKWKELISLKEIDENNSKRLKKIRSKCCNIPYYVILAEITMPLIGVLGFMIFFILTEFSHIHLIINAIKIILLFFSIFSTIGIVSFIFTKRICKIILINTDIHGTYPGIRIHFRNSLMKYFTPGEKYTVDQMKLLLNRVELHDSSFCTFYLGENGENQPF